MKFPSLRAAMCLCAAFVVTSGLTLSAFAGSSEDVLLTFGIAGVGVEAITKPLLLSGKFYATTSAGGGGCNCGTVYELAPKTGGGWTYTTLYTFKGGSDGLVPEGNIVADKAGNIYGVTGSGGVNKMGTVYELSPGSGGVWKHTVIYAFGEKNKDGNGPAAGLIMDKSGNLYGTTSTGGANQYPGTVFKLSHGSKGWTETILHSFGNVNDGYEPLAELIMDSKGNLYGTTKTGGTNADGVVFEVSPVSGGGWSEKVIYNFTGGEDQGFPESQLWMDAEGNLYGTTIGSENNVLFGTAYELTPGSDGAWTETTLHTFGQNQNDGEVPSGGLTSDGKGHLYGTTNKGGTYAAGILYRLTKESGGGWSDQVFYEFQGSTQGGNPSTAVTLNTAGDIFGVSTGGYDNNILAAAVFYEIVPSE